MDQYKTLWDGEYRGGLPLIFNIMNNLYGMGGQTMGETMGYGILARLGAGVNPEMMHAERVDGYNPLAVIDAFRRKMKILNEKKGPVLLDTLTYRISGHSPSDASSYRSKEEIEMWQKEDSIISYGNQLAEGGIIKQDELEDIRTETSELITHILKLSVSNEISPLLDLKKDPDAIGKMMFSYSSADKMEDGKPEVLISLEENPRVKSIRTRKGFIRIKMVSRFQKQSCSSSGTGSLKLLSTVFTRIPLLLPGVRRIETGEVHSPFIVVSLKRFLITGSLTLRFLKAQ